MANVTEVLLAPGHLLEAQCAAAALGRAGMQVSMVPAPDVEVVVVVVARPAELDRVPGVRNGAHAVPVLLLCPAADEAAIGAGARIGAADVVAWDVPVDRLVRTVSDLARGGGRPAAPEAAPDPLRDLTRRELEIAQLIGGGATNVGIAEALGISYHTARTHVARLMAKLGVSHRYAVVPLVQRSGRASRTVQGYAGAAAR